MVVEVGDQARPRVEHRIGGRVGPVKETEREGVAVHPLSLSRLRRQARRTAQAGAGSGRDRPVRRIVRCCSFNRRQRGRPLIGCNRAAQRPSQLGKVPLRRRFVGSMAAGIRPTGRCNVPNARSIQGNSPAKLLLYANGSEAWCQWWNSGGVEVERCWAGGADEQGTGRGPTSSMGRAARRQRKQGAARCAGGRRWQRKRARNPGNPGRLDRLGGGGKQRASRASRSNDGLCGSARATALCAMPGEPVAEDSRPKRNASANCSPRRGYPRRRPASSQGEP